MSLRRLGRPIPERMRVTFQNISGDEGWRDGIGICKRDVCLMDIESRKLFKACAVVRDGRFSVWFRNFWPIRFWQRIDVPDPQLCKAETSNQQMSTESITFICSN